MNRRDFLGSVIGAVAASPFLALLDTDPWQRVILPYRMLFRDSISGFTIQAPGIAEIRRELSSKYVCIAEPLNVTRSMSIDRAILLTEKGTVICESKHSAAHMCAGDVYKVTQTLTSNAQTQNFDELVEMFLRRKGQNVR
jgi:hypothetical protein